ncbi:MAG TPA: protein-methionine-sulfoxide reductase catalytic subunit MsrP [Verrucomicrobiae bacterium]|nr:protein-methionine-sulfoxide reductase catalytic subunit MsrP [Verrucomicrobiae bacterium]
MANVILRPGWRLPERLVTPEPVFLNRRHFLRQMGFTGAGLLAAGLAGCSKTETQAAPAESGKAPVASTPKAKGFPAARNPQFNPTWPLTAEKIAGNYNNFYEFSTNKERVSKLVDKFVTTPWPIEIGGLAEKPMTVDAWDLADMFPFEERVYRFRCVEAWSMVVPWTGFQLSKLIEKVSPKSPAKFIKFTSFNRPDEAPGILRLADYPWPYTEGLRLDEAMNPLTMVVTGIYGKPLPKQHGAPVRIVVPWKYGYKSIKSVVKIEFVEKEPATLWDTLAPNEYPFESNVDPKVPHPRWSQAMERVIDTGDYVPTQQYNGYGKYVAKLYKS